MIKPLKSNSFLYISGIVLCAAIFVLPIWIYGIPLSHDTTHHFRTADALYEMITSGELFPVWSEQQNNGYGGVVLRLYPPIPYLVLTFGKIITGNWYAAGCISFLFWSIAGGLGSYFFAREWFSERSSFIAAVLFIFAPYHAIQLYSAFIYAEFAAVSLLPFAFLFTTRICRNASTINILGLGAAFGLLILTHIPMMLIGSVSIFLYFLLCPKAYAVKKSFLNFSTAIFAGLLLSCFQWTRILSEMNFVGISTERFSTMNFYDYKENFLFSFPYLNGLEADVHQLWFLDLSLFVTLSIVISFAALFFFKSEIKQKTELRGVLWTSVFSFFMLTLLSFPVWTLIPFLQKVQFPWRWSGVFSCISMIFVAAGSEHLSKLKHPKNRPIFLLLSGLLFIGLSFTASQIIRQAVYIPEKDFDFMMQNSASEADFEEWLPIWANKETSKITEKVTEKVSTARKIEIVEWKRAKKTFKTEAGAETEARISLFYYPYWYAKVNGENAAIKAADDGAILIEIPQSESNVALEFIEPQTVKISFFVSCLSWILLIGFYLRTKFKSSKSL